VISALGAAVTLVSLGFVPGVRETTPLCRWGQWTSSYL